MYTYSYSIWTNQQSEYIGGICNPGNLKAVGTEFVAVIHQSGS